jgi:hypothetical protein
MNDSAAIIRRARTAGAKRDRIGLRAAAHEWADVQAMEEAWWSLRTGQLGTNRLTPIEAGMLLIAGRGPAVAALIAQRLVFVDPDPAGGDRVRLLAEVPPGELSNYGLRNLAFLRLLRADWRPVPPARPRYGKLSGEGKRGDAMARGVLTAFTGRDRAAIVTAIRAAAAFEKSRRFSLLAFALADEARRLGVDPGIAAYDF